MSPLRSRGHRSPLPPHRRPAWTADLQGRRGEPALLAACYRSSLALARDRRIVSIAFPAISCGVYGYPLELATAVAVAEVAAAARAMPALERVVFACFGARALTAYGEALRALEAR